MGSKVGLDTSGGEKNILLLPRIKPGFLSSPVHSPVTILSYMLLFTASRHDSIDIKFLDGLHHGKWMTVVILFNSFKGDLPWNSNYGAREGCHLSLPYQKELKMKSLFAWDIQQVDKSTFSNIGRHCTTTRKTYTCMNRSGTEHRTALFLELCVQWTPNSTVMLHYQYSLIIYKQSRYGFLCCDVCQCGGYKSVRGTCQMHLHYKSERERCGHFM